MSEQKLRQEVEELRERLAEAEDTLRAIRSGEVDAVVVSGTKGEQVYVLKGADQPYRVFLETMHEGAVTLLADGTIAYCNQSFSGLLQTPLEQVMGAPLEQFVAPDHRKRVGPLLEQAAAGSVNEEIPFLNANGIAVWMKLSMCPAQLGGAPGICLVASDITGRKRTDELRAYLASIVDSSDDAIFGQDLDGTILSWNPGAERLYGYPAGEIVGHSIATLCPPERADEPFTILQRIARGESVEHQETERVRKDGERVEISLSVSPIRDLQGHIEGASAIARDITSRRRAERAVQAERQRLFAVLETLPAMISLLTPDYHVAFANRSFRETFGESNGRHCYEYCFGRSAPCEFCESYQVLQTGRPHQWEVRTAEGRVIEAYDFPFTDTDGSPRILEMDFDITEARRAKEALERANAYNRSLIEVSLDPLVTIAADGKITDVNRATENATGYARDELIGTDFCDYFTEPERARAGYQQVFRDGSVQDYELAIRHRDGHLTPVLYNAAVYRDTEGKVAGVFAAARDIARRKRDEEALERQAAELRRSNEELQQFAYIASHDLQEPLRAISSFAKLFAERYQGRLGADADDFIGFVVDGARRMHTLINGLLDYSRIQTRAGRMQPTDCETALKEVLSDLAVAVEETGAVVTHDPLPAVPADETQFRQILQNLIGNALKFHGQDPPRVHVSADRCPGAWRFSVRDNGIGIEPEFAPQIFLIFRRLHTSAEYPGAGMGLAIAKRIVDRHGGRIWLESQPGRGSTFYFTIPAKASTAVEGFSKAESGSSIQEEQQV